MKVTLIGYTAVDSHVLRALEPEDLTVTDADLLAEYAGRICYRSFHKPNPATRLTTDYLANIIRQQHFSVLEHASATFLVEGVSRHLLGELTRHRHGSFSVESLRYCPPRHYAVHPTLAGDADLVESLDELWAIALEKYTQAYERLTKRGLPRKAAREAAAQFLPMATATDLVISSNLANWRYVLKRRLDPAANQEIRKLAALFLRELKRFAPATFQDIAEPEDLR